MEEQLSSLAVTHLLQYTLRSLCIHENSQWVYAVFWRILPRNHPPPKWDSQGAFDRSRGNRRNWILVWEDGFCNFAASTSSSSSEINGGSGGGSGGGGSSSAYGNCEYQQHSYQGLQPELFFKMSHEIYNYGEGFIGKVAADHSHKWIYKEPNDQEINFLSAWHNSADSPRTWEAQFQSGIKTIALIAVREGVIQLGSIHKVIEDLSYVVLLRKKLNYIESIPGVLLPHPSSLAFPFMKMDGYGVGGAAAEAWHYHGAAAVSPVEYYNQDHHHNSYISNTTTTTTTHHHHPQAPMKITPSMSSLEALLSKLPSVVPSSSPYMSSSSSSSSAFCEATPQYHHHHHLSSHQQNNINYTTTNNNNRASEVHKKHAKEEYHDDDDDEERQEKDEHDNNGGGRESSSSMSMASYRNHSHFGYHHQP